MNRFARLLLPALLTVLAQPSHAATPAAPPAALAPTLPYAELVDMALDADVAAAVVVRRVTWLKDAGLSSGIARLLIEADVTTLIRGKGELPAAVQFLADVPFEGRRPPKLKGMALLVLADRVPGKVDALRLVGPHALLSRLPETETRLRTILTALVAPDAPPAIIGVTSALYVAGSLPGESETQIFLKTADARPISLSVLCRPGEMPRFAVALGELVDDSAAAPKPDTLLHYRLACGLPRALPDEAMASLSPDEAAATRTDYRFVLETLGPCGRSG